MTAPGPIESLQAALAARRHFLEGRSKTDIAAELGISRFKVARLLEAGRRHGLVRIEVASPAGLDPELSAALRVAHGLREALVLASPPLPAQALMPQLGALAASLLGEVLEPADVVGVAWGRTLDALAASLPSLPPVTVVQMVGGVPSVELSVNAVDLVRRIGERAGGEVYPLHAPLVVADPASARQLRRQPPVAGTLSLFSRLTRAVVGIGSWDPPNSSLISALDPRERAHMAKLGPRADVCATLIGEGGRILPSPLDERTIAIRADQLREVPEVIAVAGGTDKVEAVRAAVRSGLVDTLVTDAATASALTS